MEICAGIHKKSQSQTQSQTQNQSEFQTQTQSYISIYSKLAIISRTLDSLKVNLNNP